MTNEKTLTAKTLPDPVGVASRLTHDQMNENKIRNDSTGHTDGVRRSFRGGGYKEGITVNAKTPPDPLAQL